jgi:hypothetical protein
LPNDCFTRVPAGEFVRSNELQEGDFIVIYSGVKSGKYVRSLQVLIVVIVQFSFALLS